MHWKHLTIVPGRDGDMSSAQQQTPDIPWGAISVGGFFFKAFCHNSFQKTCNKQVFESRFKCFDPTTTWFHWIGRQPPKYPPSKGWTDVNALKKYPIPLPSMYGIFTYIYHQNQPNVGTVNISHMESLGDTGWLDSHVGPSQSTAYRHKSFKCSDDSYGFLGRTQNRIRECIGIWNLCRVM